MTPEQPQLGVLIVGNFLSRWGIGSRCVCEDLADRLEINGWRVLRCSDRISRITRLMHMVGTTYKERHAYAVAHVSLFSGPSFIWAMAVGVLLACLRKPFIITMHGGNLPLYASRFPGRVRYLLQKASCVTTPSRFLQVEMNQYRDDIILIPNPIDIGEYRYRERFKILPTLVWVRAFHAIYNPEMVPEVINLLRCRFPKIDVTMVGPDKGDGSLQKVMNRTRELGLTNHVRFTGRVEKADVICHLDQADIFINTTNVDNTPVSIIEAMASGLCIVSTNVGGITYLLDDAVDALLIPPNRSDSMVAAVTQLLTDEKLAMRLSRNGRAKVEQWDWSIILPQWECLLRSLMRSSSVSQYPESVQERLYHA